MKKIAIGLLIAWSFLSIAIAQKPKIDRLSHRIVGNIEDDSLQVRAIYQWVCKHIKFDYKRLEKGKLPDPDVETTLRRGKAVCAGFAVLFKALCESQGIEAEMVVGYSKGGGYDPDFPLRLDQHAWNAVYIHGSWYLLDISWSNTALVKKWTPIRNTARIIAGKEPEYILKKKHRPNDDYYLVPAERMIQDHLPLMPMWQLLDDRQSVAGFVSKATIHISAGRVAKRTNYAEIENYRQLSQTDQIRWQGEEGLDFNELNHRTIGYNYIRYGLMTAGQADTMDYIRAGIQYVRAAIKDNQNEHRLRTQRNQERHRRTLNSLKQSSIAQQKIMRAWQRHHKQSKAQVKRIQNLYKRSAKQLALKKIPNHNRELSAKQKLALENRLQKVANIQLLIIEEEAAIASTLDSLTAYLEGLESLQTAWAISRQNLKDLITDLDDEGISNDQFWRVSQKDLELINQAWEQAQVLESVYREQERITIQQIALWQRTQNRLLGQRKNLIRRLEQVLKLSGINSPSRQALYQAVEDYYSCQKAFRTEAKMLSEWWLSLSRTERQNQKFARKLTR